MKERTCTDNHSRIRAFGTAHKQRRISGAWISRLGVVCMTSAVFVLIALFVVSFHGRAEGQVGFTIIDRPEFARTEISGISADGGIVTGSALIRPGDDPSTWEVRGFRWTAETGVEVFTDFPGGLISADGTLIAGQTVDGIFRWTEATGMTYVDTSSLCVDIPGIPDPELFDLSADGSILIGSANFLQRRGDRDSCRDTAFRWSEGGGMELLPGMVDPQLGHTLESGALGVSADGSTVVGWAEAMYPMTGPEADRCDYAKSTQAAIWRDGAPIQYLGMFVPHEDIPCWYSHYRSEATAASADGSVVVGWSDAADGDGHVGERAFWWTESDGMLNLGTLGGPGSRATDVSGDGTVVVGWAYDEEQNMHIFRWTGATGMLTLQGWLADLGVVVEPFVIDYMPRPLISADGNVIAGTVEAFSGSFSFITIGTGEARWRGSEDGDWHTAANWLSNKLPTAGDIVVIDAPYDRAPVVTRDAKASVVTVGNNDSGDLAITNGGKLTTGQGVIAGQSGSSGIAMVTGAGSFWNNGGALHVGSKGLGLLGVAEGAGLVTDALTLGLDSGGSGTVSVLAEGDIVVSGDIEIGVEGSGSLNVRQGGLVLAGAVSLGVEAGGTGSLTVEDADSRALVHDVIEVGLAGTGTLTVAKQGQLENADGYVAVLPGSKGTVTVNGLGSKWQLGGDLYVGRAGVGELIVADGGNVSNDTMYVGFESDSEGDVTVRNGGSMASEATSVGVESGASGRVQVIGDGSKSNVSDMIVGDAGVGEFSILHGGSVDSRFARIGGKEAGEGSVLIANGTWFNEDMVIVGDEGKGSLTIRDGSVMLTNDMSVAYEPDSDGSLSVIGPGSDLMVSASLELGVGGRAEFTLANGAKLTSGDAYMGVLEEGGATVTISGTGTVWEVMGELDVGRGGRGFLTIKDDALVDAGPNTVTIARELGSFGGLVLGNLGAGPGLAPGTLKAKEVVFGHGYPASLIFAHTAEDYVFAPNIKGGGEIQHNAGTTTLAGDVSEFSGITRLNGGTLIIQGALGGTLEWKAGMLSGTGTLPPIVIPPEGTIAPGGSIGTLRTAEITFEPGSTYEVEVNAQGESDLIEVTGMATIDGGLVLVIPYPDYAVDTPYTILIAEGGIDGEFDASDVTEGFTFLKPTVAYDPNAVVLTLELSGLDFSDVANTRNQKAVAAAVEAAGPGDLVWNAMALLNADAARTALDDLSGEIHASVKTALLDEAGLVRDVARGRADERATSGVWGQLLGAQSTWNGDGNAASYRRSLTGGIVGWDGASAEWRYGFVGGLGYGNHDVTERASAATSSTTHLGTYADTSRNNWRMLAGVTYSIHNVQSERHVRFAGLAETNAATYNAQTTQLFGEVSHTFAQSGFTWQPYAALSWNRLATAAFSEGGHKAPHPADGGAKALGGMTMTASETNATALAARAETMQTTIAEIGVQAQTDFDLGPVPASAYGRIGWRHAFGDTTPIAKLALADGSPFETAGVGFGHGASLETGLNVQLSAAWSLGVSYDGRFGPARDQRFQVGLRVKF